MAEDFALLVFDTTNMAIKTESMLKAALVPCSVIPTPVEITAECGIALLLDGQWVERAGKLLAGEGSIIYRLLYPYERKSPREDNPKTWLRGGGPLKERIRLTSYSRRAG